MEGAVVDMTGRNSTDLDRYVFRGLHPLVRLGTASDRYEGWVGQIYTAERYAGRIAERTKQVGGKSFKTGVLPVDSVDEYFDHFSVLEIDYTFYQPLMQADGQPTRTYHLLSRYAGYLRDGDGLVLKAPQMVFARKLLRKGRYLTNPDYLDAETFSRQFMEPATSILGDRLRAVVFEQEYQRSRERAPVREVARELDRFFRAIPRDDRYHVELRTEAYLRRPVFDVLKSYGVGQTFSHWTWLPSLQTQLSRADHRFFSRGKRLVVRLMTPRGVRYEDAYAGAQPFDRMVEDMYQPTMVDEAAELLKEAVANGVEANVIINNRSGGNAPTIAQRLARQFLASESH